MLGTKVQSKPNPSKSAPSAKGHVASASIDSNQTCLVAQGTQIEGNFTANENVRVDGTIQGEVTCLHRLVMGASGLIKGIITTQDAVIMGKIDGEITVKGTLHLHASAVVSGKITTRFLIVDEGAEYNGECQVGQKK